MSITYKDAGVDISLANKILKELKPEIESTFKRDAMFGIGKFAGFYRITDNLVLAASIDGVGTKVKLAKMAGNCFVIGEDIVNHSVNDLIVHNVKPLFFLDYIAMEKLNPKFFKQIIKGIVKACKLNDISLIGGETAEMPSIYYKEMFDVAGCIIGIVEINKIIDGRNIKENDVVIAVSSNGLHTNGFSLVNKIFFENNNYNLNDYIPELKSNLKNTLLKPHLSYKKLIFKLNQAGVEIKAMAHITGGGIIDNFSRVIPKNFCAIIYKEKIKVLRIFNFIQKIGEISEEEMYRTFNMGVGFIIVTSPEYSEKVKNIGNKIGYNLYEIGKIIKSKKNIKVEIC